MAATSRSQTQKKNTRGSTGTGTGSRSVPKLSNTQWNHLNKFMQTMKPAAPRGAQKRASSSSRTSQND